MLAEEDDDMVKWTGRQDCQNILHGCWQNYKKCMYVMKCIKATNSYIYSSLWRKIIIAWDWDSLSLWLSM